ncbi:hypothetical protein PI87_14500 [Ralstonia sp. A12]|uniref:hypothetical protein n=1 Tax=Ralstonia sp. A12 TaxID=1217052 RepID=UPI000574C48D|nr:hypothetical protein [Ralstonia sp. A12]KHK54809.1 hypothetical protein PI87_14500 [Ralstonia sp. A12]
MNTTNTTLDTGHLSFRSEADNTVSALQHRDIVAAFTAQSSSQRIAVLHMLYPHTDARTHRSLDHLVDALHRHGLHGVAALVEGEARYLVFEDPSEAWRALHEIRHDSLAVGVHLYYRGLMGGAAEAALDVDAHLLQ